MEVPVVATVTIPWVNKGWVWGENPIQRWCDEFCTSNYYARRYDCPPRVVVSFANEQDALMFRLKWQN